MSDKFMSNKKLNKKTVTSIEKARNRIKNRRFLTEDEAKEKLTGLDTYLASEKSLSKNWLKKQEKKTWKHLQKKK